MKYRRDSVVARNAHGNRKAVLQQELALSKHMEKNLVLEQELDGLRKQLDQIESINKELIIQCDNHNLALLKSKEQLLNVKQTMSYRLGYSLLFGFKSWAGFKHLLSTISTLRKEKKGVVTKEKIYLEPSDNKLSIQSQTPVAKSIHAKKYPQYWESVLNEPDAFKFQKNLVASTDKLDRSGVDFSITIDNVDSIVLRLVLEALEPNYAEKQAILTIDYLDHNGNSLSVIIDTPYSPSLKKYYHYLSVNPNVNNNILLCPPEGTQLIQLSVRLWDSKTEIKFNGFFETISHKTGVSIIVPSYKGEKTILKCLKSMQAQTLDHEKFEVIIALNGERDSTRNKIEQYIKRNSTLKIKILELDIAGASHARNMAIQEAVFSHITFVDDDDYIDDNYLLRLFEKARYNNIVLIGVKDVVDETGEIKNSTITEQMVRASKKSDITYNDVTSVLTMNACKIAPSHFIKDILYNEDLKSGEDVVYWTKFLSRFCPAIDFSTGFEEVVYYRVITDNSVSRQKESYDFNVSQRLDVIKDLIATLADNNESALFIQSKINAQAGFIKRYLIKHNNDFGQFQKEILEKGIVNHFVQDINALFTERLVISYCFAPYADTSAIVMSKRINQMDSPVDIISNSMSNVRTKDISLNKIAYSNIGRHIELNAPQAFANWNAIAKFSEMVVREIGNIISQRAMYKEVYSRAMWPASHFAAALVKQKYPQIKWVAEFSDPLLMDVTAKERYEKLSLEWLYSHGFIESIDDITMNDNTFYWCEYLAYEYADSIIFTNENQRDYMLSYADENLQNKILEKSKIIPQPTLPASYYDVSKIILEKDTDITYMAYFGSFYVNRGFDALFQAWKDLDNSQRKKLRLYVYTQQSREQVIEGAPEELKEFIIVQPYVGYFDFLALTKQFDILVVMDAQTKGLKLNNPYLPSKISDYLGSGSKILALVEKNSPMSRMEVAGLKICELQNTTDIQNIIIRNM